MLDLAAIRLGIKDAIDTVEGLTGYAILPANVSTPCVVITPNTDFIDYHSAMSGGLTEVKFDLTVITSRNSYEDSQRQLDAYLSAGTGADKSIFDALYANRNLSGSVDDSILSNAGEYVEVQYGNAKLGGCVLYLTALTSRK